MEFMNRNNRPAATGSTPAVTTPTSTSNASGGSRKKGVKGMLGLKLASVALLFSATILVVALLWFVVLGSPNKEGRFVDSDRLQAVFLNGGQVYFGRIKDLNDSYMRVRDIYYLRVNQQVQPDQQQQQATANDISLVKLGCELHGPQNEMLINREQVVFWENLKSDGQVAEAVAQFEKDNPNGQNCEQQQEQSSTPAQTPAQTTPTTNTNNSSNTNRNTTTGNNN